MNATARLLLLPILMCLAAVTVAADEWLSAGCKGCPDMADPAPKPTQHKDGSYSVDVSSACLYRSLFGVR